MGDSYFLSAWQVLLIGIVHPLSGPDYCLFLLDISLVGLKKNESICVPTFGDCISWKCISRVPPIACCISLFDRSTGVFLFSDRRINFSKSFALKIALFNVCFTRLLLSKHNCWCSTYSCHRLFL